MNRSLWLAGALLGSLAAAAAAAPKPAVAPAPGCASAIETAGPAGWTVKAENGPREACTSGTYIVSLTGPNGQLESFAHPRDGALEKLWVEDFDRDGSVEIAVLLRAADAGAGGSVEVFARSPQGWAARRIVPLAGEVAIGHRGHDSYEFTDGALIRRFPVYKPSDRDCCHSGGVRVLGLAYAEGRWVPFQPREAPKAPARRGG
ncbi:MAG: hypothetical protein ABI609_13905 [Acidobacteriota bacterium]